MIFLSYIYDLLCYIGQFICIVSFSYLFVDPISVLWFQHICIVYYWPSNNTFSLYFNFVYLIYESTKKYDCFILES